MADQTPDKVIDIPGYGPTAFPGSMSDADINAAAGRLYAAKNSNHPPPDPKHSWTDTAVDWLPTVAGAAGGIIGGIGGTVAGMGVGGVPGAVGGAALGGAAGEAAKQLINDARGKLTISTGDAAKGIAGQAALQGGAELLGQGAARVMRPVGEAFMQSALKPGLRVAYQAAKAGQTPPVVKTLLKEGVNVTPGGVEKLNRIIGASNQEIKDALASVPIEVNPFKVASRLGETAKRAAMQVNPESDLAAVSDVGTEFLRNHPGLLTGPQAQALKTGTYRALGDKAYTGELKGAQVEAQKAIARGLKEEIAAEFAATTPGIKSALGLPGGIDLAASNAREGAAIEARDAVARRVAVGGNVNPLGLGSLAVTHPTTLLTWLVDRSPAVKSLIARGLYTSAGNAARVNPQIIRAAVQAIASSPDSTEGP